MPFISSPHRANLEYSAKAFGINFKSIDTINRLEEVYKDALKLKNLVWEQSTDGNMFPHLYSDLDLDFVVKEYIIDLKDDGKHNLPDEL